MHTELLAGIRHRLRTVEPDTAAVTRLAAIWGRALPIDTAGALLADATSGGVMHAAREAEANGLLAIGNGGVAFPHDLVREAVYADIAPTKRTALHRLCGRHLLAVEASALPALPHFRAIAAPGDDEVVTSNANEPS